MERKQEFYEKLSSLLAAGVDIRKSLAIMASGDGKRGRGAAGRVYREISSGGTLSGALAGMRRTFSDFEVALVRSGENTGNLPEILKSLSAWSGKKHAWRRRMLAKTAYPALLFHLAVLLPPLGKLIADGALPYLNAVYKPFLAVYSCLVFLALAGRAARSSPSILLFFRRASWLLPLAGKHLKHLVVARFITSLACSLRAGIMPEKALKLSSEAVAGAVRLPGETEVILRDEGISGVLEAAHILPGYCADIVRTGEKSGAVDDSLFSAASQLESEAETFLERASVIMPMAAYVFAAVYAAMAILGFYSGLLNLYFP